ncbi:HDOD domain-containing protein [Sedimenticola hydrogenitrophicus]|uniref:HDOD domain-containing protein n=1 Tax=Sedimenticola hydrogenitrophicus TaxID=2967975 RepID=UPI0021A49798|nr:HDOD domain-containing protein [Sedimenticola hydrogenitrophicus]
MSISTGTQTPVRHSAEQLVQDSLTLISLPAAFTRLQEVMAADDSSMKDVADVVSLDPALAARLLRIANSAYYGLPSQVETITRAVNILGTRQIHDLALATSVAQAFEGLPNELMDMSTFWYRSVMCGFLARELARACGMREIESLFVRGLLLDIGHLILYSRFPEECRQALAQSGDDLLGFYRLERELIGCDANELGTQLMRSWKLPQSFVESFAWLQHPEEGQANARQAAVLHLAAWITHGLNTDLLMEQIFDRIAAPAWELTGLSRQQVVQVSDTVSGEMIEAMYRIFAVNE